jgi:hypothetical protein
VSGQPASVGPMHPNKLHARAWTVLLAVAAAITLLTSGCGGGSAPADATPSSPAAMALAYAQCMRDHGVPKYPDPTINGNSIGSAVNVNALGVSQSVLLAAQNACKSLSPQNFVPPGFNAAQNTAQAEKYAQCLRAHGVPDFPDPGADGFFTVPAGINLQGPTFEAASKACQSVAPHSLRMSQTNPNPSS